MGGSMHSTDWIAPLVVLGIGLLVGIVLALVSKKRKGAAAQDWSPSALQLDADVRDLRVERDQLLSQLRELDESAAKRAPEQIARERWKLELRCAEVLRSLEACEARLAQAPERPAVATEAPRQSSAWAGFAWGAGVAGFAAVLFFLLQSATSDRAPGGSITGNTEMVGAPAGGQQQRPDAMANPAVQAALAHAEARPDDVGAQLDLAQLLIFNDELFQAFQVVQRVHRLEPENSRALTYEAIVRKAMGLGDEAELLLDKAVKKDPQNAEAWVHRGLIAFELSRYDRAVESWEKALALRPDGQEALGPVIAEAKARLAGKPAPAPGIAAAPAGSAHPPVAGAQPPVAGAPSAPAANEASGIKVVLDLAAATNVTPGSTVFVFVRPAGVTRGPPAAAKRFPAGAFPVELTIGPGDVMIPGTPFPSPALVEARIDLDGNAMTREPGAPTASADQVKSQASVKLVLAPN